MSHARHEIVAELTIRKLVGGIEKARQSCRANHNAAFINERLCGRRNRQSLHTSCQARNLTGSRVGVHNALACGASQFRLRGQESFLSLGSITRCDCLFDLANESTNARATSLIDVGTAGDLAGRFFRRSCIGHGCLSKNSNKLRHHRGPCGHFIQQCGSIIGKPEWLPEPWAGI